MVVVSPLISLMRDQLRSLAQAGLPAAALHSAEDDADYMQACSGVASGRVKLLYVAPERLAQGARWRCSPNGAWRCWPLTKPIASPPGARFSSGIWPAARDCRSARRSADPSCHGQRWTAHARRYCAKAFSSRATGLRAFFRASQSRARFRRAARRTGPAHALHRRSRRWRERRRLLRLARQGRPPDAGSAACASMRCLSRRARQSSGAPSIRTRSSQGPASSWSRRSPSAWESINATFAMSRMSTRPIPSRAITRRSAAPAATARRRARSSCSNAVSWRTGSLRPAATIRRRRQRAKGAERWQGFALRPVAACRRCSPNSAKRARPAETATIAEGCSRPRVGCRPWRSESGSARGES